MRSQTGSLTFSCLESSFCLNFLLFDSSNHGRIYGHCWYWFEKTQVHQELVHQMGSMIRRSWWDVKGFWDVFKRRSCRIMRRSRNQFFLFHHPEKRRIGSRSWSRLLVICLVPMSAKRIWLDQLYRSYFKCSMTASMLTQPSGTLKTTRNIFQLYSMRDWSRAMSSTRHVIIQSSF